ncbi:hypothetical protein ACFP3Q_13880 [Nocardioides sp. GCM10027113]|uniref:hypothetical protein n=1 Tax=unclassified Nocardioides TaxID=2615069 RepID=UPI00362151C0
MTATPRELIVPRRFCGPPSSGNGGWTSGALAALLGHDLPANRADRWPTIRVALRQPPPLDTPMLVTRKDERTEAGFGGSLVAHATLDDTDLTPVDAVPAEDARAAMAAYPGLTSHPFPTCFACGPDREEGDGLRIFAGAVEPLDGATRIAATWTPHPSTAEDWHAYVDRDGDAHASLAVTWAALDCIGGWAGDLTERMMVLAGMTTRVDALPVVGDEHVVVGHHRGTDGRKTFTASTLYDPDGRVVALAEHVWVAVDPATFDPNR